MHKLNKLTLKKTIKHFVVILLLNVAFSSSSRAAFPIVAQKNTATIQPKYTPTEIIPNNFSNPNIANQEPDNDKGLTQVDKSKSGTFGVLSLVFAIFGYFPLSIVFGIIGLDKRRKNRELAIAGLIISGVVVLIILVAIGIEFGVFTTI